MILIGILRAKMGPEIDPRAAKTHGKVTMLTHTRIQRGGSPKMLNIHPAMQKIGGKINTAGQSRSQTIKTNAKDAGGIVSTSIKPTIHMTVDIRSGIQSMRIAKPGFSGNSLHGDRSVANVAVSLESFFG